MIVTKGEIITEKQGAVTTERLLTYSEAEKQENAVNRSNANKLFTPEFVPCYLHELQSYKLSLTDAVIYGFIRFYLRQGTDTRFYFTNAQLAQMFNVGERSISRSLQTLKDKGLVSLTTKIKSGGGMWRLAKLASLTRQIGKSDSPNWRGKVNRLKVNRLKVNNINSKPAVCRPEYEQLYHLFEPVDPNWQRYYRNTTQRGAVKRLFEKFGREALERVIKALPQLASVNDTYAPKIRDPHELEEKWSKLADYVKRKRKNKVAIIK